MRSNNIGTSYCVYILRNKEEFVNDIVNVGYELIDSWVNEEKRCEIPFYPNHSVDGYHGFMFKKTALN